MLWSLNVSTHHKMGLCWALELLGQVPLTQPVMSTHVGLSRRRFWHATHDCIAPYVDIILHRGRFWAKSAASWSVRWCCFRSYWMVLSHVMRGLSGGDKTRVVQASAAHRFIKLSRKTHMLTTNNKCYQAPAKIVAWPTVGHRHIMIAVPLTIDSGSLTAVTSVHFL